MIFPIHMAKDAGEAGIASFLSGKDLSSLGSSALQNIPARFCLHSLPEPVFFFTLPLFGL
jgi:hypothetical protein